ncbi:hypothetical protein AAGW05_04035 [Arthrobacter sp. LAPM80]|uniref:hypothetical protein n=1 Tax=Arthrobacter sp. LAPM80 TaxID=3141788 RepID=UPI00398B6B3B
MKKKSIRLLGALLAVASVPLMGLAANAATVPTATPATTCAAMNTDIFTSVNPQTAASLMSPYQNEIQNGKTKYGFTDGGGVSFKASSKSADGLVPVYRLYKNGDFLWIPQTANSNEYANAQSKYGYTSQQIDFYASPTALSCSIPVYRFQKDAMHRMVTTAADQAALKDAGWTAEGPQFWAVASADAAPSPTTPPTTAPSPTTPPTTAPPATAPPTTPPAANPDWVQWSSIAKPGDNINTVLANPALAGKILKLPAGVFEVPNFKDVSKAIEVPANVKGIVGEGRDTIIRIKANTSTYANTVPAQGSGETNQLYIMRMNNGTAPQILSDFWLQGTEQGHLYNGLMVGESKPNTTVQNILITGVPGDAGFPPGETFGLNWWRGSNSITRDIEVDGHRVTGNTYASRVSGAVVGASPIGYNSHDGAKLYNAYTHDSNVGMPTFWQSNNAETWNLQSIRNVIGINHERSFNIIHHNPVMYGSKDRSHIQFMSDQGDGNLTIIGAMTDTWIDPSHSGPIGVGVNMLILTPTNYAGPNTNSIKTAPRVFQADGKTPVNYLWAH